jgi:hypothetical protein
MVDLAIAANFVRELTEEQFAERRHGVRRAAPPSREPDGPGSAARESGRNVSAAAPRPDAPARRDAGFGTTRVGRTLSRLAQVRG